MSERKRKSTETRVVERLTEGKIDLLCVSLRKVSAACSWYSPQSDVNKKPERLGLGRCILCLPG